MAEEKFHPVQHFTAGGVGGIVCVFVGHPFDTVKVRIQTTNSTRPEYTGTYDCIKKIIQRESVFGLYKGMGTPLLTVTPLNALQFLGFGLGSKLFSNDRNPEDLKLWHNFLSGCMAGIVPAVLVTPVERIKCLLQVQQGSESREYSGPVDVVQKLTRQYGVKSIFRGFGPTLLRDMTGFGAYFASYEVVKGAFLRNDLLNQTLSEQASLGNDSQSFKAREKKEVSLFGALVAGSCAGLMYWVVAIPADVIKTRVQTAAEGQYPQGGRSALSELLRTDGIRGLYKGAAPVFIRAVPANGACFLGFELTMQTLSRMN